MPIVHGPELTILSKEECASLLETHSTGRLGYSANDGPVIVPMNYRFIDQHRIVMRTGVGSKFETVPMSSVAFEIDSFDPAGQWGWSVLAHGYATDATDTFDGFALATKDVPVWPMAPGTRTHWIFVHVDRMTGRSFGVPDLEVEPSQ